MENEMPEKLDVLLQNKAFEALTNEERKYVSIHLSPEEYQQYRRLIAESKQVFSGTVLKPDGATKINLQQKLKEQKTESSLKKILNYRIPAYQVAAVGLLLMGLFFTLTNTGGDTTPKIVYIYPSDTLKEAPAYTTVDTGNFANAVALTDTNGSHLIGRTMKEDSMLTKLLVAAF